MTPLSVGVFVPELWGPALPSTMSSEFGRGEIAMSVLLRTCIGDMGEGILDVIIGVAFEVNCCDSVSIKLCSYYTSLFMPAVWPIVPRSKAEFI